MKTENDQQIQITVEKTDEKEHSSTPGSSDHEELWVR